MRFPHNNCRSIISSHGLMKRVMDVTVVPGFFLAVDSRTLYMDVRLY
jgi:hypothetical protein